MNKNIILEIEPYNINSKSLFKSTRRNVHDYTNNHGSYYNNTQMGLRQSQIIIHYKGIGLGYGYINHWWSPSFHSSITLSSNAPSIETYSIGSFKDIYIGKYSFGTKIIVSPYFSTLNLPLYLSGLTSHLTYHSNPTITVGFNRLFQSADYGKHQNGVSTWSLEDAARLVIQPLFGQSKRNLKSTIAGTPGFDEWDEILTGFINLKFPDQNLDIYFELGSDDARGNLTDLKAHWDHTLGYIIGVKKYFNFGKKKILFASEYLSTKGSNTFNPKFWRMKDPNTPNYYNKAGYDYYTYKGRIIGAHSGSSSDDLITMFGLGDKKSMFYISYNLERHGIKSMQYPEYKTELNFTYYYQLKHNQKLMITLEYEKINNFGFISRESSINKLFWIGYIISIR